MAKRFLEACFISSTVIVMAIPTGMFLVRLKSTVLSVNGMMKECTLVCKLQASETIGEANEICTDMTGTLTQHRMTVMALYSEDAIREGMTDDELQSRGSCEKLAQCVLYNCFAFMDTNYKGETVCKGNPTDVGLFNFLMGSGIDCEKYIAQKAEEGFILFKIPFTSKRKRQTTVVLIDGAVRVFVKGAPEIVIQHCDSMIGENGEEVDLNQERKDEIIGDTVVKKFAAKCYRTLLVAYSDYSLDEWETLKRENNNLEDDKSKEVIENRLVLAGIFGLMDPLRSGIITAVT